jgi:hypothetical protein
MPRRGVGGVLDAFGELVDLGHASSRSLAIYVKIAMHMMTTL